MMKTAGLLGLLLFVGLFAFYAYETFRLRKKAKTRLKDFEWSMIQVERALTLIHTNDKDEIIAGIHILSAINHPSRLKALPRLMELTRHEDRGVVEAVNVLIAKLGHSFQKQTNPESKVYASVV